MVADSRDYRAMPVDEYLRKSAPKKLAVFRGFRSFEDPKSNFLGDQVLRTLKGQLQDLEISDMAVSGYRLRGAVSNDPDDKLFSPDDQLPLFLQPLVDADAVLLVVRENLGLPDAYMVRLTERVHAAVTAPEPSEPAGKAFSRSKPVGVVVYGNAGAWQAATTLATAWCAMGCTLPRRGICYYDDSAGDIKKSPDIGTRVTGLCHFLFPPGGSR